jgi:signal transduction histidine kinase
MPDSDGKAILERPAQGPGGGESAPPRDAGRDIVHDLNGALNNMILNIELLDRLAGEGEDGERRARSLASLRRATREIQEIVERQIRPLSRASHARS